MNLTLEVRPGRLVNVVVYENENLINNGTVFMIHGLGGRSAQWREQIALLKQHYTLIIPDLLGHGASNKPHPSRAHAPYGFIDFCQDLQIIFTKYASKENIIMGHSYGGALAAYLASLNPTRVNRLILIAPIACQPAEKTNWLYRLPLSIIKLWLPRLRQRFRANAYAPTTPLNLIEEESLGSKCNQLYVLRATVLGNKNIPRLDLALLVMPVLIILGKYDKLVTNTNIVEFYHALSQHHVVLIDDAGHFPMLEQPAATNEVIQKFLLASQQATA